MGNKNVVRTFREAKRVVDKVQVIALSFRGFVMPQNIKKQIDQAIALNNKGDEQGSTRMLLTINRDIRSLLATFFRRSPKFFEKKFDQLSDLDCDDDILDLLEDQIDKIEDATRSGVYVHITAALEMYKEAYRLVDWAKEEMLRRVAKKTEPVKARAISSQISMI